MSACYSLPDLAATPLRKRTVNGLDGNQGTEPDGRVDGTSTNARVVAVGGRLLWWDEVPRELQFNRFIASGYRANLTYRQCACSVFSCHNETGNIWAHLLPCVHILLTLWRLDHVHPNHRTAFLTVLVPECTCLLLSVAYHTFMAQVKHYAAWLKADVCGVFGVMMLPNWTVMYWGYRCQPRFRIAVLGTYYTCALVALLASATARHIMWRALPMAALSVIRLASIAHRAYLGTASPAAVNHAFWGEVLASAGAAINVFRIPERWFPPAGKRTAGKLDYVGNSHFIMHLLVVGSMWHIYQTICHESELILLNPPCPAAL